MSEETPVDSAATQTVASPPVAPPSNGSAGETPGSTPASEVTSAPDPAKPEGEKPEQSRREARAYATLRRENRELYRRLGGLEAMLEQRAPQSQPAEGEPAPQQRQPQSPAEIAAARRDAAAARQVLDRLEEAGDEIEGFDKVMETITGNFPMTTVMRDYLGDSEKPAEMAKWLAENPKEASRISLLSDAVALRSLERAERTLSAKPAPRTTTAPPPVPTVGGRSTPTFDESRASMEEAAAHWHAARAKKA